MQAEKGSNLPFSLRQQHVVGTEDLIEAGQGENGQRTVHQKGYGMASIIRHVSGRGDAQRISNNFALSIIKCAVTIQLLLVN